MKLHSLLIVLLFTFVRSVVAANLPGNVERVLRKSGNNRPELEQAIRHFKIEKDELKLKAIYFLIAHMDLHRSKNYYWVDAHGKKVAFDELAYPNFNAAISAFEKVKVNHPGIHPVPVTEPDVHFIKGRFLIDNVERAFKVWNRSKVTFKDFCEYVLPYRVDAEPLQEWRKTYAEKFSWLPARTKGKDIEVVLNAAATDMRSWFINTWQLEQRKEPLPLLGGLQLLNRRKGNCDDIAILEVLTLRSQGYPAAVDMVPYWATSSGTHFFNNAFDEKMKPIPFDASTRNVKINDFSREPSKIIRFTYSRQATAVSSFIPVGNIPPGFMRSSNYLDATSLHIPTSNVVCKTFTGKGNGKVAYAYVFNNNDWKPTWWGHVAQNKISFKDMCRGAVFLPMYYGNNKATPAGWPVAVDADGVQIRLEPDCQTTRAVTLNWQKDYLIYAPGKIYKLFYWSTGWKKVGEQRASVNTTSMMFTGVPANALLRLVPEHSLGKERPFTIDGQGNRNWW